MNESMAKARELLTKNRQILEAIARTLIEKESLEREEYEQLIMFHGIPLPHRQKVQDREDAELLAAKESAALAAAQVAREEENKPPAPSPEEGSAKRGKKHRKDDQIG
jgi:hypothetical protein